MSILLIDFVYFCTVCCYFYLILKLLLIKISEQTEKHLDFFLIIQILDKKYACSYKINSKLSCSSISH